MVLYYDNKFLAYYIDEALVGKLVKNFESQFLNSDSIIVGNLVSKKNKRFLNDSVDDIEI